MNSEQWREYSKYEAMMQEQLSDKRFAHSRGVAYTAAALAMKYGADIYSSMIAGILHDCAKNVPEEEFIRYHMELYPGTNVEDITVPHLLHGEYGAYMAEKMYHIDDPQILNAITYHTAGRTNMSLLEKIIYVADYIEPTRNMNTEPSLDDIRKMAFEDLDRCIVTIIRCVLDFLRKNGWKISNESIYVLEHYERSIEHE